MLSFDAACGSMNLLANMGRQGFLDGLGVSRHDFDRLVGSDPWIAADRNRITVTLHNIINASVDALGLPRFNLPAEFVAAGIAMFVAGVNVQAACVFAPPTRGAEEMARMASVDVCTPEQLFALVTLLYSSSQRSVARQLFEKNTNLAFDKAALAEKVKK